MPRLFLSARRKAPSVPIQPVNPWTLSRWVEIAMVGSLWGVVALGPVWAAAGAMPISVEPLPLKYKDGFCLDTRLEVGLFARHLNNADLFHNGCMSSALSAIYKVADTGEHDNIILERLTFINDAIIFKFDEIWSDRFPGKNDISFAEVGNVVGLVARPTNVDFLFSGFAVTSREYDSDGYVTRRQLTHIVDADFQRDGKLALLAEFFVSYDIDIQGQPSSLVSPHDVELIADNLPLQQGRSDANYTSYNQSAREYSDVFSGRRNASVSRAVGSILLMLGGLALGGWCGGAILLEQGRRRRAGVMFGLIALTLSVGGLLLFAEALGGVS